MQITDQQFIEAMHNAVKIAGCDNTAPGRYRDMTGAPSCVIGFALAQINMSLVPWDNSNLAKELLLAYGCSEQVANAGHYAQAANDLGCLWEDVVAVFDRALELARAGVYGIQFGQMLDPMIMAARCKANEYRQRKHREELQKFSQPKVAPKVTGGIVKGGWVAPSEFAVTINLDEFCAAANGLATELTKLTVSINQTTNAALLAQGIEPPHVKSAFSLSA